MKFKRHLNYDTSLETMNMAPLIDVIFQLLIFFMLSSSFSFPAAINVKLPKAVTSDVIKEENLEIVITSENVIYFENKVYALSELKSLLKGKKDSSVSVLIKADRRSSVGRIVDVWDLCRSLNIGQINIATNQNL